MCFHIVENENRNVGKSLVENSKKNGVEWFVKTQRIMSHLKRWYHIKSTKND